MFSSFSQAEVRDPPLHGLELRPAGGRGRHYPGNCRRPVFPHPVQKPGADLQPLHRGGGRLDDVRPRGVGDGMPYRFYPIFNY